MANKLFKLFRRIIVCFIAVLLITACSSQTPPQFYMLKAETSDTPVTGMPFDAKLLIGLGPVHLPSYLDRPQIVIAESSHRFRLDEQHRWGEHLDDNINRSLTEFLANRLGLNQILRFPWPPRQIPAYQISLDIFEFHQADDQHSRLLAQWQIKQQEQTLLSRQFSCEAPANDQAEDIVQAQSVCLGRLGLEIETGLRSVIKTD